MNLTAANTIAVNMLHDHGLAQQGWTVVWDSARGRNGQCNYARKTISLSRITNAIRDEADVRQTIIHEVAHALTPGADHGYLWKIKFRALGGSGDRVARDKVDVSLISKYRVECSVTGKPLGHANRKGKVLASSVCKCHAAAPKWVTLR